MALRVTCRDQYVTTPDRVVRVSVLIGQAQIGASVVKIDGLEIARGEIDLLALGVGREISGHQLLIRTVVTDINFATNRTSVLYSLIGGPQPKEIYKEHEAQSDHDTVFYELTLDFE